MASNSARSSKGLYKNAETLAASCLSRPERILEEEERRTHRLLEASGR
jgi:hypothetical protein